MSTQRLHFPISVLTHNGGLILGALATAPAVAARLPAGFAADANTLLGKVTADDSDQKMAKGGLGALTKSQTLALNTLHRCIAQSAKTATLAFRGQSVKLHQEFQTGHHDDNSLSAFLGRADIVLASIKNASNLAALKLKGWIDDDTNNFQAARDAFGPAELFRKQSTGAAKTTTVTKNADAVLLYETILTVQNAADLALPKENPANSGARDAFLLGIFPPDHGGNTTPPAAPTSPTP